MYFTNLFAHLLLLFAINITRPTNRNKAQHNTLTVKEYYYLSRINYLLLVAELDLRLFLDIIPGGMSDTVGILNNPPCGPADAAAAASSWLALIPLPYGAPFFSSSSEIFSGLMLNDALGNLFLLGDCNGGGAKEFCDLL